MILTLARDNSGRCVGLRLPAKPADIAAAYRKLDAISIDDHQTHILRADTGVGSLDRWLRDRKMDRPSDYIELGQLSEKIDRMDDKALKTFDGALTGAAFARVIDILRIADSLDDYIFINGVTTEKELGRFLVDSGYKGFPESIKPYLDYNAIGTEYYAERGGAFTGSGYTLRRSNAEPMIAEQKPVFCLKLQSDTMHRLGHELITLELPADENRLRFIKDALNIEDFAEAEIVEAKCTSSLYQRYIPLVSPNVYVLEELAENLSEIESRGETFKMLSVLALKKPATAEEAARLAVSLDSYEDLHCGEEDYGKEALLRLCGDQEIVDTIDGFINWQEFGEYMMEQDGFVYAEFGYIREKECPQPSMDMGMQMQGY